MKKIALPKYEDLLKFYQTDKIGHFRRLIQNRISNQNRKKSETYLLNYHNEHLKKIYNEYKADENFSNFMMNTFNILLVEKIMNYNDRVLADIFCLFDECRRYSQEWNNDNYVYIDNDIFEIVKLSNMYHKKKNVLGEIKYNYLFKIFVGHLGLTINGSGLSLLKLDEKNINKVIDAFKNNYINIYKTRYKFYDFIERIKEWIHNDSNEFNILDYNLFCKYIDKTWISKNIKQIEKKIGTNNIEIIDQEEENNDENNNEDEESNNKKNDEEEEEEENDENDNKEEKKSDKNDDKNNDDEEINVFKTKKKKKNEDNNYEKENDEISDEKENDEISDEKEKTDENDSKIMLKMKKKRHRSNEENDIFKAFKREKKEKIKENENNISEGENNIDDNNNEIKEKNDVILKDEKNISEKENNIDNNNEIKEKNDVILKNGNNISERKNNIDDNNNEIKKKDDVILKNENNINNNDKKREDKNNINNDKKKSSILREKKEIILKFKLTEEEYKHLLKLKAMYINQ
jgi:hypothetical protein